MLTLLLLLAAGPAAAETVPARPPDGRFVADAAGVLDAAAVASIDGFAAKLWREEQVPLYLVTIPSLASQQAQLYTIKTYAFNVFNTWGIGSQEHNLGILLLLSKEDRQARIELGWEWGDSHNAEAERIMSSVMVPNFKSGDYARGLRDGAVALDVMARGRHAPKAKAAWGWPRANWPGWPDWDNGWTWAVAACLAVLSAMTVSVFVSGKDGLGHALFVALGAFVAGCLFAPFSLFSLGGCPRCGRYGGHAWGCPFGGWGGGLGGWGGGDYGGGSAGGSSSGGSPSSGGSSGGGGASGSW